jgi:manganese/zinc/iron transport system permease protein
MVDRDADAIEHVLDPEMIAELEALLQRRQSVQGVPRSPHEIPVTAVVAPTSASEA